MIVCYIAGPYTATKAGTVGQNIENARRVASEIRSHGMAAVVPHLESIGCEGSLDYEGWIAHGVALMRKCDCVVLLEGWDASKGAQSELEDARWNSQPVFFSYSRGYLQDIERWWENNKWKK
jgi:hypothetical protein